MFSERVSLSHNPPTWNIIALCLTKGPEFYIQNDLDNLYPLTPECMRKAPLLMILMPNTHYSFCENTYLFIIIIYLFIYPPSSSRNDPHNILRYCKHLNKLSQHKINN